MTTCTAVPEFSMVASTDVIPNSSMASTKIHPMNRSELCDNYSKHSVLDGGARLTTNGRITCCICEDVGSNILAIESQQSNRSCTQLSAHQFYVTLYPDCHYVSSTSSLLRELHACRASSQTIFNMACQTLQSTQHPPCLCSQNYVRPPQLVAQRRSTYRGGCVVHPPSPSNSLRVAS